MSCEFLENVAIADVAFKVCDATVEELFVEAGKALTQVMIRNIHDIRASETHVLHLTADTVEMLLFNFLQEIIYYKDAKQLLLSHFCPDIKFSGDRCVLVCEAAGEILDPARHEQIVDVKAVTLHHFSVSRDEQGWSAFIILDI